MRFKTKSGVTIAAPPSHANVNSASNASNGQTGVKRPFLPEHSTFGNNLSFEQDFSVSKKQIKNPDCATSNHRQI